MSMRVKATIIIVLIIFVITGAIYASNLFFAVKNIVVDVRDRLFYASLFFLAVGSVTAFFFYRLAAPARYEIESQNRNFVDINETARISGIERRGNLLEAALEEAREANNAKSNFLARMSHEIRTPLNAVIGLSELTLEAGGLSEESHDNLEKIYNSGAMLLSIVNDILDISKIEAGKLELIPVDYDIPSLINDMVTQSTICLGEKPIKFILNIDENLPARLHGDDLRVKQIISNLLSNACKYTKQGAIEFGINCERENGTDTVWMTIFVSDTGIGINPEDIENRLFKDYAKMDATSNRAIEGTGLGLPIARMLVELMGGSITVESEYGKGSTFTARFQQKRINDDVIGVEAAENLKGFRHPAGKRTRHSQLVRIRLPYARVLVVDDNATNLDVAKGMLRAYGMKIDCVTGGQQAIDAIRMANVRYDAIFMDHIMPKMDGVEATRIIREEIGTKYAKTVPIIALTANAITGNKEMFLSKGFQAFISKPLEIRHLDAVIRRWVRDKNREDMFCGETSANTPKKYKPDYEILKRIRAACEKYDIDGLDAAMVYLEAFEYESDNGLAVWLRENVDRMNYEEITEELSSFSDRKNVREGVAM